MPAYFNFLSVDNFCIPHKILLSACNNTSAMSKYAQEHNLAKLFNSTSTLIASHLSVQGNAPFVLLLAQEEEKLRNRDNSSFDNKAEQPKLNKKRRKHNKTNIKDQQS